MGSRYCYICSIIGMILILCVLVFMSEIRVGYSPGSGGSPDRLIQLPGLRSGWSYWKSSSNRDLQEKIIRFGPFWVSYH